MSTRTQYEADLAALKGSLTKLGQLSADAVDYDFNTIKRMLAAEIAADPGKVDAALDVLMVIKYLERIGDHAVNIAEWVEFLRTGRYHHEKMF